VAAPIFCKTIIYLFNMSLAIHPQYRGNGNKLRSDHQRRGAGLSLRRTSSESTPSFVADSVAFSARRTHQKRAADGVRRPAFHWNPPQPATSCTAFCHRLLPSPRTTTCDPAGREGKRREGRMSLPTPPFQLGVWGSAVSSPSWVRGEAPVVT